MNNFSEQVAENIKLEEEAREVFSLALEGAIQECKRVEEFFDQHMGIRSKVSEGPEALEMQNFHISLIEIKQETSNPLLTVQEISEILAEARKKSTEFVLNNPPCIDLSKLEQVVIEIPRDKAHRRLITFCKRMEIYLTKKIKVDV